ncbi:MAG: hypothetical protein AAGH40_02200, partial [Verrucomicrobiota bacterium]
MREAFLLIYSLIFFFSLYADTVISPLTDTEALAIVSAEEEAKELAKDARELELQSAEIIETAVADLGYRKVIFNRVKGSPSTEAEPSPSAPETVPTSGDVFPGPVGKEQVSFGLSGTVYDEAISEIWWDYEGTRYRIFTNANFSYFSGISEVESETKRYSILTLFVNRNTENLPPATQPEEWRPTLADFTPDVLEYYIVDWGDEAEPDLSAFEGIDAMLSYYSENSDSMKIAYENTKKL